MKKILFWSLLAISFPALFFCAEDPRIVKLKDRREGIIGRQVLAKMLVKEKSESVGPVLEKIYSDPNEEMKMRVSAAKFIGELPYKDAFAALLDVVKNKDEDVDLRQASVEAIGAFDDKQSFLELGGFGNFSNKLAAVYLDAVEKSRYRRDKDVLLTLGQFLSGSLYPEIKKKAIALLSESNDKRTLTLLMIALQDKTPSVRKDVIKHISRIGGSSAVPLYINRLEEEKRPEIREMFADELLKLPIPKLKKVWIEDLTKRIQQEPLDGTKEKLTQALDRIKKAQANPETAVQLNAVTTETPAKVPIKK